jgi:hypothetical protein
MSGFSFHSEQTRSVFMNGEVKEISEITNVKGNSGTKTVIQRIGAAERQKTIQLTQDEVKNIQGRIFMPKLFKPCHDCLEPAPSALLDPLGPAALLDPLGPAARSKTRAKARAAGKSKTARSKRRPSKKASK